MKIRSHTRRDKLDKCALLIAKNL